MIGLMLFVRYVSVPLLGVILLAYTVGRVASPLLGPQAGDIAAFLTAVIGGSLAGTYGVLKAAEKYYERFHGKRPRP